MEYVIDLVSHRAPPRGRPDRPRLVDDFQAKFLLDRVVNLPAFPPHEALAAATDEVTPVIDRYAFIHDTGALSISAAGAPRTQVSAVCGPVPLLIADFARFGRPGLALTFKERRSLSGCPA